MIFAYTRVSTEEQAADGTTSLAEQERKCKAIASLRSASSFDFATFVDSGVSGATPLRERPAGAEMLSAAQKGDCIVATKMDRLFRSASDALTTAEELKKKGVDIILIDMGTEPVTGNGCAKIFFGMLALFAEFERDRIAERMLDGQQAKRKNGGHTGGLAPYGFTVVGSGRESRLEKNESEQELLRLVAKLSKETVSPWFLGKRINEMGFKDRAGNPFRVPQVKRLMERANG